MATSTTVPLTVLPEAAARVAELGMQAEFERMLQHTRQTLPGLRSIRVYLAEPYDTDNEPRVVIQLPGIHNWNLSLFKNFAAGGRRRLQFRVEAYNLLNTLQFKDVDKGARFDAAGNQVNANFGKATAARNPRIMQGSVRFTF